jgi:membrane protein YqaA with SNARE-associated domain
MTNHVSSIRKYLAISILALTVIISVGGSVLLVQHWEYVKLIEEQGLLGLFLISVFAGSPLPIPTPSMILTFTMGSIVNPILVAVVSGLGNGVGNVLVYLTGRGGLAFFRNLGVSKPKTNGEQEPSRWSKIINKLRMPWAREFARKSSLWAVLVLSIYPNPILTPVIMGMGAARYSFWKFFASITAGKIVQSLILSYLGYFGLRSILHYFGVTLP